MDCIGRAPTTVDEWVAAVNRCAAIYGGPDWTHTAMLGLIPVMLVGFVILLVFLKRG